MKLSQKLLIILLPIISLFAIQSANASSANVEVKLSPAGRFAAQTEKVEGYAVKNADGSVKAENIVVDLNSLSTGIELRDKHTKEHLEVTKYPTATLIKAEGKDGKGKGTVSIHGKTQEVTGTYKIEGSNLKAEFNVNLPSIDIKKIKYMGIGVKDDVMVSVVVPIKAAGAASTNTLAPANQRVPAAAPKAAPKK